MPPVVVNMYNDLGDLVAVPAADVRDRLRIGYTYETPEAHAARVDAEIKEERNSGVLNGIAAGALGFARGATLGLSDTVVGAFSTADDVEEMRELREMRPNLSLGGEVAGMVVPALLTGGASAEASAARTFAGYTPAGAVSKLGTRIAGEGASMGRLGRLGAVAAAGATEGALGNAGMYLSDVALGDRELSGEAFVGAMKEGGFYGGVAGGVALGIEKGMIGARKLFSRAAMPTKKAAEAAESAVARDIGSAVEGGEATSQKVRDQARQLVRDERLKQAQAKTAQAEQKLATQKALDEERLTAARAKTAEAGKPKAPTKATAPAKPGVGDLGAPTSPGVPTVDVTPDMIVGEAARGGWTDQALDDSARLAEMLGQTPANKKIARAVKAAEKYDAAATAVREQMEKTGTPAVDPRGWAKALRGRIAEKSGGTFTADTAAATLGERSAPEFIHGYRTKRAGRSFDASGDMMSDAMAAVPDDVQAVRPITDIEDLEKYDAMITRASVETDEAARAVLLREAADFEEVALRSSMSDFDVDTNLEILAARERLGMTGEDIARQRADSRAGSISRLTEQGAEDYVSGTRRPFKAGPLGPEQADAYAYEQALRKAPDPHGPAARERIAGSWDTVAAPRLERKPFADEAYESIEVIDRMERANYEMVEAATEAGIDAHPAAKAAASDYAKAMDEQARKQTTRAAQHVDDVADGAGSAEVASEAARKNAKKATGGSGVLEAATGLEAMDMAGVPGMPGVEMIPVIGPLLKMWMRARVVRKLLFGGGAAGHVAATGETKAAAFAAKVRDRAAVAVDRLLSTGAKGAAGYRKYGGVMATPHVIETLKHRLFDDGVDRPEPKTDAEAALARIDELAAAQANPAAVRSQARRALADATDPDLVDAVASALQRKLGYLASVMPKAPPPSLLGRVPWKPSQSEIQRFARSVRAADDPASVFEDLAGGNVAREATEALRAVYPQIYAEAANRLMARAAELSEQLPYQRVLKMAVLFDAPLVQNLIPERIAALQTVGAALGGSPPPVDGGSLAPPTPSVARPPDLESLYTNPADRRAMRRAGT